MLFIIETRESIVFNFKKILEKLGSIFNVFKQIYY
jgi:hypothetical protein